MPVGVLHLKRFWWASSALLALGGLLLACGGTSNPNQPNVSGLTKRILASNSYSGVIYIIDGSLDIFSDHLFQVAAGIQQMALSNDRSVTLVFNGSTNVIAVLNNSTEQPVSTGIALPAHSDGFAAIDNTNGFASARNANEVLVLDLVNSVVTGTIPVQTPVQVTLGNLGRKLLVFSDTLTDTFTVIDTTTAKTSPSTAATQVTSPLFDHPISGVFSSDDTKAYILSCGPECGGVQASVTVVDMTTTPPTVGNSVPLPAATVALLNSNTLYVAGNDNLGVGQLSVVDTGALTASAPVQIGDGFHWKMGLDTHNHLFIGAKSCAQLRCLTIYDTSAKTATVEINPDPTQNGNGFGDVGGIQAVSGRDRMYLAQGGEIRIFDTTIAQPLPLSQQLDAVGHVEDVLQIDP